MDMKKILQALDTASSKPVEGSNDMKKFLSVVTEGANPHKVSLPVQMAMNHYQEEKKPAKKDTLLRKYFAEAEELVNQQQAERKEHLQMYAQQVAKRVLENRRGGMDAYDRDVWASQQGFGRKDSLAYQMDGGANDEGWDEEEPRSHRRASADVPHDVHIDGRKWKTFSSHSHANNVARKLQAKGKKASVHRSFEEGLGDTLSSIGSEIKGAVMGKSPEEWAKASPQMAALLQMRAQYPNNPELEKRIGDHKMRLELGKGEVMGADGKPIIPLPPKQ